MCVKRGLPPDVVNGAGGQLYTSGSYRLGVHEPGADIDAILVCPSSCTREDFFGSGYVPPDHDGVSDTTHLRDPTSLAERIRTHADVTNFVPVENAAVPILTFDWEGVNIDLLFARLATASVPASLDIDNDSVLDGVDPATEKSLNGPRVTNLIAALVSGTPERYQTFLKVVRCVRKWAKSRGLYSNKMGYWGGVNINIAVALVVQLYPRACPASLLRKFFLVFKSWRWPNPVMLTRPHDAGLGLVVWNAGHAHNARQVAPVITPAYPAMNSTMSVSRQTLQILHEEFCRGHEVVDRLWKDHQRCDATGKKINPEEWAELFRPSDFFIAYPHYLSLCIVGPTQADAQAWAGFVESRLRKLVSDMLGKSLPLGKVQLWPKKFEACVADRTALLTHAQRINSATYFVGFRVDALRMRGNQLNVEQQIQNFREWELTRFQPLVPGMDVMVKCFKVKELPKIVFENMYDGGKLGAMKRRRSLRDADPRVQERKRAVKLRKLKVQMERMQRKKREAEEAKRAKKEEEGTDVQDEERKSMKRRRVEGDYDGEADEMAADKPDAGKLDEIKPKKEEDTEDLAQEETDLLESALDAIQQDAVAGGERKTREEAEADRKKLLAGELLVEGGAAGEDAEDEEAMGYTKEGVRRASSMGTTSKELAGGVKSGMEGAEEESKPVSLEQREAEILRRVGYTVVSDDENSNVTLGGNMVLPWRRPELVSGVKREEDGGTNGQNDKLKSGGGGKAKILAGRPHVMIKLRTKFDVVELDAEGRVVDKGDDDFQPSKGWTGRRGGFEFKLGERGLGYYRTGKKVVVPSNTAY